jgi:nucleotide-binding universal stress UspA family protein
VIVIAYDGSEDAKAAVQKAGQLFKGETATVVSVWQRFVDTMARVGGGIGVIVDYDEIDGDSANRSEERAAEGAKLANSVGLQATGKSAVVETTLSDAIIHAADDVNADVLVLGTRGLTGVKSALLGSVSHHVLQHADRPVLVVPSPEVAAARAGSRSSGD